MPEWLVVYRIDEKVRPRELAAFLAETAAAAARLAPPHPVALEPKP